MNLNYQKKRLKPEAELHQIKEDVYLLTKGHNTFNNLQLILPIIYHKLLTIKEFKTN